MSGETNKLIEYAEHYTKSPVANEMDMLLSSGERVTSALLSIVITSYSIHYTKLYEFIHFTF